MTTLHTGDCLEVLRAMPANSADSIVTDPPYGLSFMGKAWDKGVPGVEVWREALRVLKPGGHLLAFAGTRTQHRMATAIENAGFEIRDMIAWVYGSGFPKSANVSKMIDKAAGAEREVVGPKITGDGHIQNRKNGTNNFGTFKMAQDGIDMETAPATPEAQQWDGWGTALKPALEPITVARKPLAKGTVAANVLAHGTGALNVDGCRVATEDSLGGGMVSKGRPKASEGWDRPWMHDPEVTERKKQESAAKVASAESLGRWPANLIHSGCDEVVGLFPDGAKPKAGRTGTRGGTAVFGQKGIGSPEKTGTWPADEGGSAARFFYCAKASKRDRDEGCEGLDEEFAPTMGNGIGGKEHDPETATPKRNTHPTVKPTNLMRYLCRLVTPPGGTVLDPFMGSGSTGKAALLEGFAFIGIDVDPNYVEIARARIGAAQREADKPTQEGLDL